MPARHGARSLGRKATKPGDITDATGLQPSPGSTGAGDSPTGNHRLPDQGPRAPRVAMRTSSEPGSTIKVDWSGREDLNLRPHRPERCALPSCATPRPRCSEEPADDSTSIAEGRPSRPNHTRPTVRWRRATPEWSTGCRQSSYPDVSSSRIRAAGNGDGTKIHGDLGIIMSLIERVERARRLNAAAEVGSTDGTTAVARGTADHDPRGRGLTRRRPAASRAAAASAAAMAAEAAAQAVEEAPVAPAAPARRPATPIPVAPEASLDVESVISVRAKAPVTTAAREECCTRSMRSFRPRSSRPSIRCSTLGPDDVRTAIDAIVEDVVTRQGFAVTRRRAPAARRRRWSTRSPASDRSSRCSATRSITEVMVNGPRHIYIERGGKIQRVDVHFLNDEHVRADHRPDHHPARPAHRRDRARASTPACPTARASTPSSSRCR